MQGPGTPARPCKADSRFPLGCGPHMCGPYTSALRFVGDGGLNATRGQFPSLPYHKTQPALQIEARAVFYFPNSFAMNFGTSFGSMPMT